MRLEVLKMRAGGDQGWEVATPRNYHSGFIRMCPEVIKPFSFESYSVSRSYATKTPVGIECGGSQHKAGFKIPVVKGIASEGLQLVLSAHRELKDYNLLPAQPKDFAAYQCILGYWKLINHYPAAWC
jgi:hypothetical protein